MVILPGKEGISITNKKESMKPLALSCRLERQRRKALFAKEEGGIGGP